MNTWSLFPCTFRWYECIELLSHLFPLSESMFYIYQSFTACDIRYVCTVNMSNKQHSKQPGFFHYGFLSYMYSVVLVDVCTISSQCYFDYYHKLLTQVFGILLQNFVSHTYIAIRVIKCVFKRAEVNSRRPIVRSREISKARGPFLQFSNRSEIW